MKKLSDIIPQLKKRLAMFTGVNTIESLAAFINGYYIALDMNELKDESIFQESVSFHDWVALRLDYYESTKGWAKILLEHYGNDEEALKMFFIYLDEYQSRKEFVEKKINILGFNKANSQSQDILPDEVEIIKYTENEGRFLRLVGNNVGDGRQLYCRNNDAIKHELICFNYRES